MATKYCAIIYAVETEAAAWGGMLQSKLGGKTVLNHSLDVFEDDPGCAAVIVVADAATREWVGGNPLEFASAKMRIIAAAGTRHESMVQAAREASQDLLVLHDALRPNFGTELLERVLATVRPGQGAAPAVAVDRASVCGRPLAGKPGGAGSNVLGPKADHRIAMHAGVPGTEVLYAVQSPQAYLREDFLRSAGQAGPNPADAGDISSICQAQGLEVAFVPGRLENMHLGGQDELHVLQKLMGTGPKKKEKYTGLGW